MPKTVLLSIKPAFAEKILNGEKAFEFRRTVFKDSTVKRALIYASYPACLIIGEFEVGGILTMSKSALWRMTKQKAGISWRVFSEYFSGKQKCNAIRVVNPIRYDDPVPLYETLGMKRPPQSFAYIKAT